VRNKNRQSRFCLAAALAVSAAAAPIWAQSTSAQISEVPNADVPPATTENSSRPVYQLDRSEENWSGLCRHVNGRQDDLWDSLKCFELRRPFWYASFGAELRGSCEVYRDYNWGSGPQDRNGYYLNRLIGHADFHLALPITVKRSVGSGPPIKRNNRSSDN
jgi:hypothetical protein